MKIQYCSDLHLEFEKNNKYIKENPLKVQGEVLILGGDIVPLHDENFNNPFLKFAADNFEQVYWVPGNHEFYHTDLASFSDSFIIELKSNLKILHNKEISFGDIQFIFSTLWSNIGPMYEKIIEQGVSDFECITKDNKRFRVSDYNNLHQKSIEFISKALSGKHKKKVVVTHHLPSDKCNSLQHSKSIINEAFCTNLTDYVKDSNANFWIYGHSHFNQKPLYIGDTILLTNQLGYVHLNEHNDFKDNAFFSI